MGSSNAGPLQRKCGRAKRHSLRNQREIHRTKKTCDGAELLTPQTPFGIANFLWRLGAEEFAGFGADLPGSRAESDVARDVGGVVEHDDRFALREIAGPVEGAAGHGFVAAYGKFERDHAFAEAPETGLLFGDDRADGIGASVQELALTDKVDDDSRDDGQENGNSEESEELEFAGLSRVAKNDDEIQAENPEEEERDEERELGDGIQGYVARRVLEDEVAVSVEALAGAEGLGGAGFRGEWEHLEGSIEQRWEAGVGELRRRTRVEKGSVEILRRLPAMQAETLLRMTSC